MVALCAMLMAAPVSAQTAPDRSAAATPAAPATPSVAGYLCQFAGKCGDEQVSEAAERDAPATRGFRLGRPSTDRAPAAAVIDAPAPAFAGKRAATRNNYRTTGRTTVTTGRYRPSRGSRYGTASVATPPVAPLVTPRTAPVAGSTARRADLMIGFELNSARLSAKGRESARVFAQSLVQPALMGKRFVVEGHTDLRGGRALNLALSQRRAEAVIDFLAAQGVDRARLSARGLGPDAPLTGRPATDPANRRVEAELLP